MSFKYLAITPLAGRGGVLRFFMLIHGLAFDETLVQMNEWADVKTNMIESNENPCGSLPVLSLGGDDSIPELSQHVALCRFLYREKVGVEVPSMEGLRQDMVADEYQGFRNAWAGVAFSGDNAAKEAYKKETVPVMLTKFNALYNKYAIKDTFLTASVPLWADVALSGLLYDHIQTGLMAKDDLKQYSKLNALYEGFSSIPAVAKWMNEVKP